MTPWFEDIFGNNLGALYNYTIGLGAVVGLLLIVYFIFKRIEGSEGGSKGPGFFKRWWDKRKDKKNSGGDSQQPIPTVPQQGPSQNPQQKAAQVKAIRQRQRTEAELNTKYREYAQAIKQISIANRGKIPSMETKEGKLRHRYIQAMIAIEKIAKNKGIKLKKLRLK